MNSVNIAGRVIGESGSPLALFAGPCVIESESLCEEVASTVKAICDELGIVYVFKASFDKANRTSASSFRGQGLEKGLEILQTIKEKVGVPVMTDVHEPGHCAPAAEVCEILQIPAFLCRQTDLLLAAAATGRIVNIKKGQFLAPWDMKNVVDKMRQAGCKQFLLCERGVSFGYNTLVVDMRSLPIMRALGQPVVFDGTHSVQQPGGQGTSSGGQREFIPSLVRAAVATGAVDALFLETHPNPDKALSDAATMHPLSKMRELLSQALALHDLVRQPGFGAG
ncbi:MAG: 3-deoxy-8-phosphooctulonate synthase [Capsulimonadaceae bacterium]|nr:3-deoxy-8-phosphooctulonate synthase [Capsulimonadaceae bacterium]